MSDLKAGRRLKTASGNELTIIKELGRGGQGVVYEVDYLGSRMALKRYFPGKIADEKAFYDNLRENVKNGAPDSVFLWPREIVKPTDGAFGYLMELRRKEYVEFSRFLLTRARFASVEAATNAALNVVKGFRALHNRGYSYQDLNDGNFFFNPATGDASICDNDNVAPYGTNLGIAGKCRYMAPEVVVGKKLPNAHTDRFSLAVILYRIFFLDHPLEGARTLVPCLTEELERRFYGDEPIFVWDPTNNSNRPVPGAHSNEIRLWPLFPQFVRDAFTKAFSRECLVGADAERRPIDREQFETLARLRAATFRCASCGNETFLDAQTSENQCVNCRRRFRRPAALKTRKYVVALTPGKRVYAGCVRGDSGDFETPIGEVAAGRVDPTLLGLRNESKGVWRGILPSGVTRDFAPGQTVKIDFGLKIDFGGGNIAEIV